MKRQRGIALLGVLWAGIVLALLAGGVSNISRGDVDLARNQLESARAELAAEAAAEIAILGLLNGGEDAISANGAVYAWLFDGAELRVQVLPEAGRIDLNRADEPTLTQLFAAAGADPEGAEALAQSVIDFRDPDDLPMPLGAEDEDYASAGAFLGAKDAPFESVEELAGVLGVTREIYRAALSGVTVYTGRGRSVGDAVPPIVAAALSDGAIDQAAPTPAFTEELTGVPQPITDPISEAAVADNLTHVHAEATTAGGAVYALDLIIQTRRRGGASYRTINRRRGEVELFAVAGLVAEAE